MVHAKNYETMSTFVEVMQKKTVASFFSGHGVVTRYRKWQLYNVKYQYTILVTATTVASVDEALSAHFAVPPVVIHPFPPSLYASGCRQMICIQLTHAVCLHAKTCWLHNKNLVETFKSP